MTFLMRNHDSWSSRETLIDFLAGQLAQGSLAIVLGAGASSGFGLPDWKGLVDRMASPTLKIELEGKSVETQAEFLRSAVSGGDDERFREAIRQALYKTFDRSISALLSHQLLRAVAALTMASSRGSVGTVVTFNYDDVLETLLSYFGYDALSVVEMPSMRRHCDVAILHPHGVLPADESAEKSCRQRGLVLAQSEYDRIVGNARDPWHRALVETMASHVCLFIGLSGEDKNLTQVLTEVAKQHASMRQSWPFWGVRFGKKEAVLEEIWRARKVFPYTVADHSETPDLLLDVCRRAAALRRRGRT